MGKNTVRPSRKKVMYETNVVIFLYGFKSSPEYVLSKIMFTSVGHHHTSSDLDDPLSRIPES